MKALKKWVKEHQAELGIFAVAFLLRAVYDLFILLHSGSQGFLAFSDAHDFYYTGALDLLHGHGSSIAPAAPYYPDGYHTPLYPLFVATLFYLHFPLFGVMLVQALLAAGYCLLFYRIVTMLTGSHRYALSAGLIAALEPMSIYWCGLLMSDVLFAFILVLSFYFMLQKSYVATAMGLGIAALTRPIAMYFMPFYIFYIGYVSYTEKKNVKELMRDACVVIVLFSAIVSVWFARNKIEFDTWGFSSAGWYNLYVTSAGTFAEEHGMHFIENPLGLSKEESYTRFSFKYEPYFRGRVVDAIRLDVPGFIVFESLRSVQAFFASKYGYLVQYVIDVKFPSLAGNRFLSAFVMLGDAFWNIVYALALVGFTDKKLRPVWLFIAALAGANAFLSGNIDPTGPNMTRYSIPFIGFYVMFACVGITYLLKLSGAAPASKREH